ncbi:MAG: SprT-like domain-containing protein [Candidatus Thiosymbion ectosymbiont of Robbea hypermnestra]|nr:SprT-like domain-containing protein [Candidatus Thiosymbion ectosymbiont of Robbea hypermnestra]
MASKAVSKAGSDLQYRAERLTNKLLALAARHFGAALATPKVRFDLRGKNAGQARVTNQDGYLIRYNAQLLERHPRAFLAQTVPHETAHLVAYSLFGPRISPHGRQWRTVMAIFGAPPERCHDYDIDGLQTRHLRRYDYRCACRTHRLTSIRHNRVRSGQTYRCRQCGQPLERDPRQSNDG